MDNNATGLGFEDMINAFGSMRYAGFQMDQLSKGDEGNTTIDLNNLLYKSGINVNQKTAEDIINGKKKIEYSDEMLAAQGNYGHAGEDNKTIYLSKSAILNGTDDGNNGKAAFYASTLGREGYLIDQWSDFESKTGLSSKDTSKDFNNLMEWDATTMQALTLKGIKINTGMGTGYDPNNQEALMNSGLQNHLQGGEMSYSEMEAMLNYSALTGDPGMFNWDSGRDLGVSEEKIPERALGFKNIEDKKKYSYATGTYMMKTFMNIQNAQGIINTINNVDLYDAKSVTNNVKYGLYLTDKILEYTGIGNAYEVSRKDYAKGAKNEAAGFRELFETEYISGGKDDEKLHFCSGLLTYITGKLGINVPDLRKANKQIDYMEANPGEWLKLEMKDSLDAIKYAKEGYLVVAGYNTHSTNSSGHVTVVMPYGFDDNGNKVDYLKVDGYQYKVPFILGHSYKLPVDKDPGQGFALNYGINYQPLSKQYTHDNNKYENTYYYVYKGKINKK